MSTVMPPTSAGASPPLVLAEIPELAPRPLRDAQGAVSRENECPTLESLWPPRDVEEDRVGLPYSGVPEDKGEFAGFHVSTGHGWRWLAGSAILALGLAAGTAHWVGWPLPGLPLPPQDHAAKSGTPQGAARKPLTARTAPGPRHAPAKGGSQGSTAKPPVRPAEVDTRIAESEKRISSAVGDAAAFGKELQQRLASIPQGPSSNAYRRVIETDLPILQVLNDWDGMLDRWHGMDMRSLSAGQARKLLTEATALLNSGDSLPGAAPVRSRCECLTAIAARVDDNAQPIQSSLLELFRHPALAAPLVMRTDRGLRYYLSGAPERKEKDRVCEYFTDLTLNRAKLTLPFASIDRAHSGTACQGSLARTLIGILDELTDSQWESKFFKMLTAIRDEKKLDPLLQAMWLERVMTVACRGSRPMEDAFGPHRETLRQLKLGEDVDWIAPEDPDMQRLRADAAKVVKGIPAFLEAVRPAVAAQRALKLFPSQPRQVWVGRLARGADGTWTCPCLEPPAGPLFVIYRESATGPIRVEQVAGVVEGRVVVSGEFPSALLEGRPVFSRTPASDR
jgi:hypothetical protein